MTQQREVDYTLDELLEAKELRKADRRLLKLRFLLDNATDKEIDDAIIIKSLPVKE